MGNYLINLIIYMKNYGFKYEEREDDHYIVGQGNIAKRVIFEDGHGWGRYRPKGEVQYNKHGIDGWTCVLHSICKAIGYEMNRRIAEGEMSKEELDWLKDNELTYIVNGKLEFDANDIVLAVLSGAKGRGTSLQNGAETLRESGLVGQDVYKDWENARTVKELLKSLPQSVIDKSEKFLEKYEIKHEWLFDSKNCPAEQKKVLIKNGFKNAVIQVAGAAWLKDTINSKGYYGYTTSSANHAYIIEDYEELNDLLEKTIAHDTYIKNNKYTKDLAPEYLFWQAKQFYIISKFKQEKNMQYTLHQRPEESEIYVSFEGDSDKFHIKDEDMFKKMFGNFADYKDKIIHEDFPNSDIQETLYFKNSFIKLILSFFTKLGKKK